MATAAYLRNLTTTSANEEQLTSFETWYGSKPNISHLRVFGCAAYTVMFPAQKGENLTRRHKECVSLATVRIQKDTG